MSRKEKYENSSRRQQTFLSPEDIAAGRKTFWHGIEITGKSDKILPQPLNESLIENKNHFRQCSQSQSNIVAIRASNCCLY